MCEGNELYAMFIYTRVRLVETSMVECYVQQDACHLLRCPIEIEQVNMCQTSWLNVPDSFVVIGEQGRPVGSL